MGSESGDHVLTNQADQMSWFLEKICHPQVSRVRFFTVAVTIATTLNILMHENHVMQLREPDKGTTNCRLSPDCDKILTPTFKNYPSAAIMWRG